MSKLNIAAAFIAGILDGFGWLRARNWLSDRIDWTGRAIDAFDLSSDWFCIMRGKMTRVQDDEHNDGWAFAIEDIEIDLELDR